MLSINNKNVTFWGKVKYDSLLAGCKIDFYIREHKQLSHFYSAAKKALFYTVAQLIIPLN